MTDLSLFKFEFEGKSLDTLTVDGRPAWIARQIGAILGYANDGKRFANKVTGGEWRADFVDGKDFCVLRAADLGAVKAAVPDLARETAGLVVLFESGVHMALVKTHMPLGRKLRRFLVDEVLPQLARTGAYVPAGARSDAPVTDLDALREIRRAARVDLDDRTFRADQLRYTASVLHESGHIATSVWAECNALACEIALGRPIPGLRRRPTKDWVSAEALADRFGILADAVVEVATDLGLTDRADEAFPFPLRGAIGWTVSFRFSPKAAALLEALLEGPDPEPASRAA